MLLDHGLKRGWSLMTGWGRVIKQIYDFALQVHTILNFHIFARLCNNIMM
jgi:hypothetical protein